MIRDKFITIFNAEITETLTGGSTQAFVQYWKGWAKAAEKNYSTALQTGQWVAKKSTHFFIRKNAVTALINENMQIEYRGKFYLIENVTEIDSFHLSLEAKEHKTIVEV
jgi:head-tail adaptor